MNGADYVYLLEKEQEYKTTYETIKQKYHILKNSVMLSSLADMPNDINVLKMDCEGCELSLLTEELLNKSKEFVIGLHKPQLDDYKFEQKKRLLEKHGAKYFGNVNNEEFVWVKKA
ncbi:FkbM family methyltransferase [Candidatus Marsarchaeota archaeon]|nr:FkbM family methyltransferase [Candidatus Marsarchaeota archaeon]